MSNILEKDAKKNCYEFLGIDKTYKIATNFNRINNCEGLYVESVYSKVPVSKVDAKEIVKLDPDEIDVNKIKKLNTQINETRRKIESSI